MSELNPPHLTEGWMEWWFGCRPWAQRCMVGRSCSQRTALHIPASPWPCDGLPRRTSPSRSGFPFLEPVSATRAYLWYTKKSQSYLVKFQETKCLGRKLICLCCEQSCNYYNTILFHSYSLLLYFMFIKQVGSKVHTFITLQNPMIRNILTV